MEEIQTLENRWEPYFKSLIYGFHYIIGHRLVFDKMEEQILS